MYSSAVTFMGYSGPEEIKAEVYCFRLNLSISIHIDKALV